MSAFRTSCLMPLVTIWVLSIACVHVRAQVTFTTLHNFSGTEGASPYDSFIVGRDGNFYGTTAGGGANGAGAIIKVTLSGAVTTLYSFSKVDSNLANTEGAQPYGSLVEGSDGNFYGTCWIGGANGNGTVFKVTPAGTLTLLHTFSARDATTQTNADGARPQGALVEYSDGNFYGIAPLGGANRFGTFYQITLGGQFTTLHAFIGTEGVYPTGLILGSDGDFYCTAPSGGNTGGQTFGTAFKITSTGTVTVLHSFYGYPTDGGVPIAVLTVGADGNFYGTTQQGGANNNGTVFKMTPAGTVTVLHSFGANFNQTTNDNADGSEPYAALLLASDGNFYGTAYFGGANGDGSVFKITPDGTFTLLHTFSDTDSSNKNTDGADPLGGLVEGSDYNLYGSTQLGGPYGMGVIFQLNVHLIPPPTLTSLHPGSTNAAGPAFTLIVKGSAFQTNSVVEWTEGSSTTSLTTTYVSATELKAAVPASLIAGPGKARITVSTPSAGTSAVKLFTVKLTTLKLVAATLTRDSTTGNITANITLRNVGYLTAPNVTLTKSTLGPQPAPVATTTPLPISLGSLAAGGTVSTTLTYPGSAGASGTVAYLKVSGRFTGGSYGGTLKVTLP